MHILQQLALVYISDSYRMHVTYVFLHFNEHVCAGAVGVCRGESGRSDGRRWTQAQL